MKQALPGSLGNGSNFYSSPELILKERADFMILSSLIQKEGESRNLSEG